MAIKKCDDIVEDTTTTTTDTTPDEATNATAAATAAAVAAAVAAAAVAAAAASGSDEDAEAAAEAVEAAEAAAEAAEAAQEVTDSKPRRRKKTNIKEQTYLGKTLELVENNVYDDTVPEESYWWLPMLSFGNGNVMASRPSDIADPLRAELRAFFATDEEGRMTYLKNMPNDAYGDPAINIVPIQDAQEVSVSGRMFKKYTQDFSAVSYKFYRNTGDETITDANLAKAWSQFVIGGTDEVTGLSRPSQLIDMRNTFTDHYTNIVVPFSQDELDRYINNVNNPAYADVDPIYNFYITGYEERIRSEDIKEYELPNLYSEITKQDSTLQQALSKLGSGVDYINGVKEFVKLSGGYEATAKFRNIGIPTTQVEALSDGKNFDDVYPMNNSLEMKTDKTGQFLIAAEISGMTDSLLKLIMNESIIFGTDIAFRSANNALSFAISNEQVTVSESDGSYKIKANISEDKVPLIDLESWLSTYFDENNDYDFNTDFNTETILLGLPVSSSEAPDDCNAFANTLLSLILLGRINQIVEDNFRTFEEMLQGKEAYNETLVYEIKKKSVNAGATQSVFVPNTEALDILSYIDTQVKYNKEYTYSVYAHQLILGTEYKYTNFTGNTTYSTYGASTQFSVEYRPSLKIAQIPVYTQKTKILDSAPISPNVDIIPFKGVTNQLLINLSANVGDYDLQPVIINDRDAKFASEFRKARKLLPREPIKFKSDDLVQRFEIYRMDTPPKSYKDFNNNLLTYAKSDVATSISFLDSIAPNQKYYYTFRGIDIHGNRSNPTEVYQAELVEFEGMIFFEMRIYNFEEVVEYNNVKTEREFRRYLKVNPNLIQSLINYEQSIPDGSTDSAYNAVNVSLGKAEQSVWNKKFKIRVTSKNSGKKFDINLTCKVRQNRKKHSEVKTTVDQDYAVGTNLQVSGVQR